MDLDRESRSSPQIPSDCRQLLTLDTSTWMVVEVCASLWVRVAGGTWGAVLVMSPRGDDRPGWYRLTHVRLQRENVFITNDGHTISHTKLGI